MYFGFTINEYQYRLRSFTCHRTREAAEKRHAVNFDSSSQGAQSDLSTYVMTREELIAWAKECNYEIDWKGRTLTYKGDGNDKI